MATTTPSRSTRRHGVASTERRDPLGHVIAALGAVARSDVLDRLGIRKQTEKGVFTIARTGFTTAGAAGRAFTRAGRRGTPGTRVPATTRPGVFDLTPTEDEQMLVDVATELAEEVVRPAAAEADESCTAPEEVLAAARELGLQTLGVPESLGGISEERSAMAGTLVAEALARGDLGLAVATLAPGSVATAISLWGTDDQQQTYLPAFTGDEPPAAALALTEPQVLFDVLAPTTTARRDGSSYVLDGTKALVPLAVTAELFVVGALVDDGGGHASPALFLVESATDGVRIESDPAMGVRAASLGRLHLDGVRVPAENLLGDADGSTYAECVRLSRLAWCALSLGVGQAVLDYVTPYVKERKAFGEPVAHRQSVAFMVADIATELEAMRLLTYQAASRAAQGRDFSREVALARRACGEHGMRIGLDGVQLLGGHGFVKEHPVERWYRDLRSIGVMEGAVLV
ncbi:acyl-CoA dehydrogenase family protein [Nocardioides lentus]|uniref:Acyl-CoA dehydrogenase family protein n=1 Tax=Nocardioides lentus TaxID=338077 RepID=A0ABN2P1D4_9ACTN